MKSLLSQALLQGTACEIWSLLLSCCHHAVYYCSQSSALIGKQQKVNGASNTTANTAWMPQLFGLAKPWSFPSIRVPTRHFSLDPSDHDASQFPWVHMLSMHVCLAWTVPSPQHNSLRSCPLTQQASCFIPGPSTAPDSWVPSRQWASLRTSDKVSNAWGSQQVRGQLLLGLHLLRWGGRVTVITG
jgi:hypothetical protein